MEYKYSIGAFFVGVITGGLLLLNFGTALKLAKPILRDGKTLDYAEGLGTGYGKCLKKVKYFCSRQCLMHRAAQIPSSVTGPALSFRLFRIHLQCLKIHNSPEGVN